MPVTICRDDPGTIWVYDNILYKEESGRGLPRSCHWLVVSRFPQNYPKSLDFRQPNVYLHHG